MVGIAQRLTPTKMRLFQFINNLPLAILRFGGGAFVYLILLGCTDKKPAYIKEIPDYDIFEYATINDWRAINHDTTTIHLWYDSEINTRHLRMVSDILHTDSDTYWVADILSGNILEFDSNGQFIRELFASGRGPSEVLHPIAIDKTYIGGKQFIYIMDINQQMLLVSDLEANEVKRHYIQGIPTLWAAQKLTVLNQNEFIWPNVMQDFVLTKRDSSGNHTGDLAKALIPLGFQPVMHNIVKYDHSKDPDTPYFIYAYHGLPIVMAYIKGKAIMINLEPEIQSEDLNTSLTLLPLEQQVTVFSMIHTLFYHNDSIWIAYKTNLIKIPFDKEKPVSIITFVDIKGEKITLHPSQKVGDFFTVVNNRESKIYRKSLEELESD